MAAFEQIREGEIRPDQLEIGKVYRIEQYGRSRHAGPHKLIDKSLGRFKKRWGGAGIFIEFTIVAPGTSTLRLGQNIDITSTTSPRDNFHYRFFETAQDRIVPQFEQRALESVFEKKLDLGKAATWGLTKDFLAPSTKKSGGRKYKTRQTKLRRKNKTRKNRGRTHRRR
jgi:hypothetical protein